MLHHHLPVLAWKRPSSRIKPPHVKEGKKREHFIKITSLELVRSQEKQFSRFANKKIQT